MGLVQAGFLAAMAALAFPVLVHLLSRWQVRRLGSQSIGTAASNFDRTVAERFDTTHRRYCQATQSSDLAIANGAESKRTIGACVAAIVDGGWRDRSQAFDRGLGDSG